VLVLRISNGFKLAAVFTAVILGAGFASGQELLKYFVNYGLPGLWGLLLSGVVFSLAGWATLDICRKQNLRSFGTFTHYLLGGKLAVIVEWLVCAFLFVLFSAMLAASGAAVKQAFGFNFSWGVAVMGGLCFIVLLFDLKGFVRINMVLMPFMVIGGIFVGLYAFFNQTTAVFAQSIAVPGWIAAAGVYASYNLVTGIPVLASASSLSVKPVDSFTGGVLGGGIMTLLGLCLALPLYLHHKEVISVEIPFLLITLKYGSFFSGLYLLVLFTAIFTTAISNAFALVEWCVSANTRGGHNGDARSKTRRVKVTLSAIISLLAVGAAYIGFSNIVSFVYPVFGFLGLFMIVVILFSWRR
jgi:uncharacterized membrane protein YkvI